jgi:putative flippase GtrA
VQQQALMVNLIQPIKFALVGVLNTGWSYLLYAAFLYLGLNYWVASFLTIVLSVGFGFLTQGNLVFGGATRQALPRFILVWVVIYGMYLVVVSVAQHLGINNYLGGLIATPLVAVLSYILQRRFVFAPPTQAER